MLRAEIDATGELAKDQYVHPCHDLGPQRRPFDEARVGPYRTQIRIQAELLSQCKKAGLGACCRLGVIPLRAADGAEENGVGHTAGLQRRLRQRAPVSVDGGPTHGVLGERETLPGDTGKAFEHLAGFPNDLRTDAVTGEQGEVSRHVTPL